MLAYSLKMYEMAQCEQNFSTQREVWLKCKEILDSKDFYYSRVTIEVMINAVIENLKGNFPDISRAIQIAFDINGSTAVARKIFKLHPRTIRVQTSRQATNKQDHNFMLRKEFSLE